MKKFLIIFVLCFFCSNVAFSKPKMYYCIEEESTGFKPDGKGGYNQTNWFEEKFKAKIDFDNLFFDSDDIWTHAKCSWLVEGVNVQCLDSHKGRAIKITKVGQNFDKLKFTYTDMSLFLRERKNDLKISYGNCEKF